MLAGLSAEELLAELTKQLPRLLFAAVDGFPLAGGIAAGSSIPVLAIRAVPVRDRLDERVASGLDAVVRGCGAVQQSERLLSLQLPAASGETVHLSVCWHDIADFAGQLLRGNPSCLEAVALEEPPLYCSPEWSALREVFGTAACTSLMEGKTYRNACAGPVMSLALPKGKKKKEMHNLPKDEAGGDMFESSALGKAAALLQRACSGDSHEALRIRVLDMLERSEARKAEWFSLASEVMQASKGLPNAMANLPVEAVEAWVDDIRRQDFAAFAAVCAKEVQRAPAPKQGPDVLGPEWAERLGKVWPQGAKLVFQAQTGSFMYNLQVPSSDSDFTLVYLSSPETLAARVPPPTEFQRHAHMAFGSDKQGEVEFSGKELGQFLLELSKGNPRTIELLFTDKPHFASPVWQELVDQRRAFLTLRCARQYAGFISDRVHKASAELGARVELDEDVARRFSKLLYHAHHKLLELTRILLGGQPAVALTGAERDFVMGFRVRPPSSREEAQAQLTDAETKLQELLAKIDEAQTSGALPEEVDAAALASWLRSVRARGAAATAPPPLPGALQRMRSAGDVEAISAILSEIEDAEGLRIVHAAYGSSSRTLGTMHANSDHDVKLIFVLPRSEYLGLRQRPQKFQHCFPASAGLAQVEVSGWEAQHCCRMLTESNPTVLHMLHSPTVFKTTRWADALRSTAAELLQRSKLFQALRQHSRQNYHSYIKRADSPLRKRYVHVLSPILRLAWMQRHPEVGWAPPQLLELARGVLSGADLELVEELVARREELAQALPHDHELDALVERLLASGEDDAEPEESAPPTDRLDRWHRLCAEMVEDLSSFAF